jgi:hypothetical protein
MTPAVAPALHTSIARFSHLFAVDVAEQMDVPWERVLTWLETRPSAQWDEQCPGWSPVVYDPPRRAKENIKSVSALVLDYDKRSTWDAVVALWSSFYGLIYTTKSHDIGAHRVRVVLPLSRAVSADEYATLWQFASMQSRQRELEVDGQAKDASRFWYVPTAVADWRTLRLTGQPLDVDATLPLVEQPTLRVVRPVMPDTQDQRIERARRYLAKLPGAVSGDGGHTATFNAVASIMFGFDLDEDTTYNLIASEYNPRCDPAWSERELQHKIKSAAQLQALARLSARGRPPTVAHDGAGRTAGADANGLGAGELGVADHRDRQGQDEARLPQRAHVRALYPDYRGRWSLDTMTGDVWFGDAKMPDTFVHEIRAHADRRLGFSPGREDVEAAIATCAEQRPFHPIQNYLRSVDWDGVPRLASMAYDYFGSESTLHSELVKKWMISAVARAMNPGCKVDTALMLHGEQGYFKSSFFAILGAQWHADSAIDIANKDSFQQIHAAWLYEFAELENVVHGRAESRLKAWLTSTHDMFRAPYARSVTRKARSCVICGTTNRKQFLTDETGSRRFWIVSVQKPVPRELLAEMRDQIWAEAFAAYEAGEQWWLDREQDVELEDATRPSPRSQA